MGQAEGFEVGLIQPLSDRAAIEWHAMMDVLSKPNTARVFAHWIVGQFCDPRAIPRGRGVELAAGLVTTVAVVRHVTLGTLGAPDRLVLRAVTPPPGDEVAADSELARVRDRHD